MASRCHTMGRLFSCQLPQMYSRIHTIQQMAVLAQRRRSSQYPNRGARISRGLCWSLDMIPICFWYLEARKTILTEKLPRWKLHEVRFAFSRLMSCCERTRRRRTRKGRCLDGVYGTAWELVKIFQLETLYDLAHCFLSPLLRT